MYRNIGLSGHPSRGRSGASRDAAASTRSNDAVLLDLATIVLQSSGGAEYAGTLWRAAYVVTIVVRCKL